MARLKAVTDFLDHELNRSEIPDYPGALNGLQIENAGEVSMVVSAVDASLPVIEKAVALGGDLLVVHHGIFWQGAQKVTGAVYRKLKLAMDHDMALYSSHIPLDVHPALGNNVLLAKQLGMSEPTPFFDWKGIKLGLRQELDISRDELFKRVSHAVGGSVHQCLGGNDRVGMVGVITGGAGSEVAAMVECGIDTFVTGEGPHWSYALAEELGINVFYAGHYATETFGVRALASELGREFGLKTEFIDHPTGL